MQKAEKHSGLQTFQTIQNSTEKGRMKCNLLKVLNNGGLN